MHETAGTHSFLVFSVFCCCPVGFLKELLAQLQLRPLPPLSLDQTAAGLLEGSQAHLPHVLLISFGVLLNLPSLCTFFLG